MRRVFQLEDKQINDAPTPNQNLFPISTLYLTQTIKTSGILKPEGNEKRNLATQSWNIATRSQKTEEGGCSAEKWTLSCKTRGQPADSENREQEQQKGGERRPWGIVTQSFAVLKPCSQSYDKLTALGNLLQTNPLTRQSKWTHFAAHRYLTHIRLRFLKVETIQKGSLDTGSNYIQSSKNLWNVARFWKWPFCV